MKVGDAVKVKDSHHADPGMMGILLEDFAKSAHNRGKAFRVLLSDGRIATKMARNLEVIAKSEEGKMIAVIITKLAWAGIILLAMGWLGVWWELRKLSVK